MNKTITLTLALLLTWAAKAQSFHNDSIDLAAGIQQVEENYAGFPSKVNDSTRAEYETLKERLWADVRKGREGYMAVAELMAWFEDFHLRCASYTNAYRKKQFPDYGENYNPQSMACKVNEDVFLIRVPSFEGSKENVANIVAAQTAYLESGCKYLIVDIRGNGGGADHAYYPLATVLYDHVGTTDGVEVRATQEHAAYLRSEGESWGNEWLVRMADSIANAHDRAFIPLTDSVFVIEEDSVLTYPIRAAVLIDRYVASSGEQFVLELKATSARTQIYGAENTLGCLDFSNLRRYDLPKSGLTCMIPMTRSFRVGKGQSVDDNGIAPDVRITLPQPEKLTDNIDSWVLWVAEELQKE